MVNKFSQRLLNWYKTNQRNLPWTGLKDPYKVWLSEIILQQTRVEQGRAYYLAFIKKFPTVFHLAKAPEDQVMKMWEGLGYYSRAVNMHATAKEVVAKYNGVFPDAFEKLIPLKGIGNYTAYAILSYAFSQPFAVADGNVLRIISRIYGIKEPVDSLKGRKKIETLANKLLDKKRPGEFNQAMMDFGSLICKPKNPLCEICPFKNSCTAYLNETVFYYPVKEKSAVKQKRYFNYFVLFSSNKIIIEKRIGNDIWKNLYQFPLIESDALLSLDQLKKTPSYKKIVNGNVLSTSVSEAFSQQLTHRSIKSRFFIFEVEDIKDRLIPGAGIIKISDLKKYSFPGTIREFLKRNSYF
ncbi:MAG: A/G-specific adenine glycosylase [Chitinophagales bacterium]